MIEIRCKNCGKLLGTTDCYGFEIDMMCPRCKEKYKYKIEAQEAQG